MAEFIAYLCNDHNLTSTLFQHVQLGDTSKLIRSAIGWLQDGRTLRRESLKPTQPTQLTRVIGDIPSRALIGYQTEADDELQPLRFRRLVFAHTGEFSELPEVTRRFEADVPEFLRSAVQGSSASSGIFRRFLHELNELDILDKPFASPQRVSDALADVAIATIAEAAASQFASVAISERTLAAVAHGTPLYYRVVRGIEEPTKSLFAGHLPKATPYPNFKAAVVTNIRPHVTDEWETLSDASLHIDSDWTPIADSLRF